MRIPGRCHCGNVAFELEWPGEPREIVARACACSFCVKHGCVWTAAPDASLDVTLRERACVSEYVFGTRTARFFVCSRCGAVPVVTSEIDGRLYAAVNVNMFEGGPPVRRSLADFEGESREARLARRARGWIPNVQLTDRGA